MDSWAIVEIMGHRKLVGRARDITWLGGQFLEVEPLQGDGTFGGAERYGANALFSYRQVTEEQARRELVPRRSWHCFGFDDSPILPGSCAKCGNPEAGHGDGTARALPAHEEDPARGCCGEWETGSGQHGDECVQADDDIPI